MNVKNNNITTNDENEIIKNVLSFSASALLPVPYIKLNLFLSYPSRLKSTDPLREQCRQNPVKSFVVVSASE